MGRPAPEPPRFLITRRGLLRVGRERRAPGLRAPARLDGVELGGSALRAAAHAFPAALNDLKVRGERAASRP